MNGTFIYVVHSDINENNIYAEFLDGIEALEYAKRNSDEMTFVEKVEVILDEEGEIIDELGSEIIWSYDDEYEDEDDYYEDSMFEDLVETLEGNESLVECKQCFELFPKAEGIKLEVGYLCPHCNTKKPLHVIHPTMVEDNVFKLDFPEQAPFEVDDDEFLKSFEVDSITPVVEADPKEEVIADLVKDEVEAIAGYDAAKAQFEADQDLENKEEVLNTLDHIKAEEEEHIKELEDLSSKSEEENTEIPLEEATKRTVKFGIIGATIGTIAGILTPVGVPAAVALGLVGALGGVDIGMFMENQEEAKEILAEVDSDEELQAAVEKDPELKKMVDDIRKSTKESKISKILEWIKNLDFVPKKKDLQKEVQESLTEGRTLREFSGDEDDLEGGFAGSGMDFSDSENSGGFNKDSSLTDLAQNVVTAFGGGSDNDSGDGLNKLGNNYDEKRGFFDYVKQVNSKGQAVHLNRLDKYIAWAAKGAKKAAKDVQKAVAKKDVEINKVQQQAVKTQKDIEVEKNKGDARIAKAEKDIEVAKNKGDQRIARSEKDVEVEKNKGDARIARSKKGVEVAKNKGEQDIVKSEKDIQIAANKKEREIAKTAGKIDKEIKRAEGELIRQDNKNKKEIQKSEKDAIKHATTSQKLAAKTTKAEIKANKLALKNQKLQTERDIQMLVNRMIHQGFNNLAIANQVNQNATPSSGWKAEEANDYIDDLRYESLRTRFTESILLKESLQRINDEFEIFDVLYSQISDCGVDKDLLEIAFLQGLCGKDLEIDSDWLAEFEDEIECIEDMYYAGLNIRTDGLEAYKQDFISILDPETDRNLIEALTAVNLDTSCIFESLNKVKDEFKLGSLLTKKYPEFKNCGVSPSMLSIAYYWGVKGESLEALINKPFYATYYSGDEAKMAVINKMYNLGLQTMAEGPEAVAKLMAANLDPVTDKKLIESLTVKESLSRVEDEIDFFDIVMETVPFFKSLKREYDEDTFGLAYLNGLEGKPNEFEPQQLQDWVESNKYVQQGVDLLYQIGCDVREHGIDVVAQDLGASLDPQNRKDLLEAFNAKRKLVETLDNRDRIRTDFEEAGYETDEASFSFDQIYDNFVKKYNTEPNNLKELITFVQDEVADHYAKFKAAGFTSEQADEVLLYKVQRRAKMKMRSDGSTFIESYEIPDVDLAEVKMCSWCDEYFPKKDMVKCKICGEWECKECHEDEGCLEDELEDEREAEEEAKEAEEEAKEKAKDDAMDSAIMSAIRSFSNF